MTENVERYTTETSRKLQLTKVYLQKNIQLTLNISRTRYLEQMSLSLQLICRLKTIRCLKYSCALTALDLDVLVNILKGILLLHCNMVHAHGELQCKNRSPFQFFGEDRVYEHSR